MQKIPFPILNEQTSIANYLDSKTASIDGSIETLKSQKELLIEEKKAIIHKAVTQGLNPDVPMKDSGVEWIGMVPSGLNILKLKNVVSFDTSGEVIDKSFWGEGEEITYSASKKILRTNFNDFPSRKRTTNKDLLLARNGDGNIHIPINNSIYTNVVQLIRINELFLREYIFYFLTIAKTEIAKKSYGDIIASLNREQWFNGVFIVNRSKLEQKEIVDYLDLKTSKIEEAVAEVDKQISLLEEYKKTLINDVVTGKIRVYEGEI